MVIIPINLSEIISRSDRFPISKIDDTLIAVDRDLGSCYAMNATTARIWDLISTPVSGSSICDTLCNEFDVDRETCERDVAEILGALRNAGLIQ